MTMTKIEKEKFLAAEMAIEQIESGMIVGLGTGSTAEIAIKLLAQKIQKGLKITGVPTSLQTKSLAERENIKVISFPAPVKIDITIDGADEFDDNLQLIKGGGGALLHEKIVASASTKVIIIADSRKQQKHLGATFAVPVEVIPFAHQIVMAKIKELRGTPSLRLNPSASTSSQNIFVTQESNYILDCNFGSIMNPSQLAEQLNKIPGVVEHGLFINIAHEIIFARDNTVAKITKK